jgi:hypothetical protein
VRPAFLRFWELPYTPESEGNIPVSSAERDGQHTVEGQYALLKTIAPPLANASMCGVIACRLPPKHPTQSFKSSTAINRTLDLPAGDRAARDTAGIAQPTMPALKDFKKLLRLIFMLTRLQSGLLLRIRRPGLAGRTCRASSPDLMNNKPYPSG